MKLLKCLLLCCLITPAAFAQGPVDSLSSEKTLRDKILNDIQESLDRKNSRLDSTIAHIDVRVDKLDSLIKASGSAKEKAEKLLERVQALEDKQKALEQNELNIYQANYQSAVINLLSMDREIKPLVLFHTAKDFFSELAATGNPATYPGYKEWFAGFNNYVEKNKDKDVTLEVISNSLKISGDISASIPVGGVMMQVMFNGMSSYVNAMSNRQKALKEQSKQMLLLTMTLGQFCGDRDKIEVEWEGITKSLGVLQADYDKALTRNLATIQSPKADFYTFFSLENDADKRYLYLTEIRKQAADVVSRFKKENPKDWKEKLYYELADVQALKLKYGEITLRIYEHIQQYNELIKKYKADKLMGGKVSILETKLSELNDTFDKTFEPQEYIHSVSRMYKVG